MRYISMLLLIGMQAKGYVTGYARLYNPVTKKSVDVVYDLHKRGQLKDYQFKSWNIAAIKEKLYSTEKQFFEVVEAIDNSDRSSSTALVCESRGADVDGSGVFLGYFNRLFADRLKNIMFIDADMVRNSFDLSEVHCFGSYKKRFPLSMGRVMQIILRSGIPAWCSFIELYKTTFKEIHYKPSFWDLARIADLEMVLHILSLPHSHIIVYCGAWHGANITGFLKDKAGYVEVYAYNAGDYSAWDPEIEINHLWPLEYIPQEVAAKSQIEASPEKLSIVQQFATR